MNESAKPLPAIEDAILMVVADYRRRRAAGEAVDIAQLAREHPQLMPQLAQALRRAELIFQSRKQAERQDWPDPSSQSDERDSAAVSRHDAETHSTPGDDRLTAAAGGAAMPLGELPRHFGRYEIVRTLGRGNMGAVYLAQDRQLGRQVAVKVPLLDARRAEILARFHREARLAASLRHPNICAIHDIGELDGRPFLTMAFIDGQPLSARIRDKPPLSLRTCAELTRKLAQALEEAHRAGVLHRDLKPSNVMLDGRGEPILMDFGLACLAGETDNRLTQSGAIVGSPAYMSPEQVGGGDLGPATDIYSLGVLLYELLTGELPFRGAVVNVIANILASEPPRPSLHRPDVDATLEQIVARMMAKRPQNRYGSMAEVAAALEDYLGGRESAASVRAVPQTVVPPPVPLLALQESAAGLPEAAKALPSPPRRIWRPLWIAAAGLPAVLLLAAVIVMVQRGREKTIVTVDDKQAATIVVEDGKVRVETPPAAPDLVPPQQPGETPPLLTLKDYPPVPSGRWKPVGEAEPEEIVRDEDGQPNYGVQLAGDEDDYLYTMALPVKEQQPLTLEAWIDPVAPPAERPSGRLIQQTSGFGFGLYHMYAAYPSEFFFELDDQRQRQAVHGGTRDGGLRHVAAVWDGEQQHLFVAGRPVKTVSTARETLELRYRNVYLEFGSRFNGVIDEIRISRIARYRDAFDPPRRLAADEDTLLLYHFDEGSGVIVRPDGENEHPAALNGGQWVVEVRPP